MSVIRTPPVLQTINWLTRGRPRVFLYHRFGPRSTWRSLGADVFDAQMRLVRQRFAPMTVSDLCEALRRGTAPANAVAITIDDGYEDVHRYALPVLRRHEIPATFYVTTGFVDRATWLWPDRVSYLIEQTPLNGVAWTAAGRNWALALDSDLRRRQAWLAMTGHVESLPRGDGYAFLDDLAAVLEVALPVTPPAAFSAVSWSQLGDFVRAGIEIGDHSWSHPNLTRCSPAEVDREIAGSKALLEARLHRPVRSFAYPHGAWTPALSERVRDAGFSNAVCGTDWRLGDWARGFAIPRLAHGGTLRRFETAASGVYDLAGQFGIRMTN